MMKQQSNSPIETPPPLSFLDRREFLNNAATGLGAVALAWMLDRDGYSRAAETPSSIAGRLAGIPHFPPKAKRCIHIFSPGGVSHVDTFEEALQTLRSESFDLVISRAADFIPLQGVHSTSQAAAIIDSVSQGVCIVRQTGDLEWANPTFLSFSAECRGK